MSLRGLRRRPWRAVVAWMLVMVLIMPQDSVGDGGRWLMQTFNVVVNSDAGPSAFVQEKAAPKGHRVC